MAREDFPEVLKATDVEEILEKRPDSVVRELVNPHSSAEENTTIGDWYRLVINNQLFINHELVVWPFQKKLVSTEEANEIGVLELNWLNEQITAALKKNASDLIERIQNENKLQKNDATFLVWLYIQLRTNPEKPSSLIKALVEKGLQHGFGNNGTSFTKKCVSDSLALFPHIEIKQCNIVFGEKEISQTVDAESVSFMLNDGGQIIQFSRPEEPLTAVTTFKLTEKDDKTTEYSFVEHTDTLQKQTYNLHKAAVIHTAIAYASAPQKYQAAVLERLNYLPHYLEKSHARIDEDFEKILRELLGNLPKEEQEKNPSIIYLLQYLTLQKLNTAPNDADLWSEENIAYLLNVPNNTAQQKPLTDEGKKDAGRQSDYHLSFTPIDSDESKGITLTRLDTLLKESKTPPALRTYISALLNAQGLLNLVYDKDHDALSKTHAQQLKVMGFGNIGYDIHLKQIEPNKLVCTVNTYVKNAEGEILFEKTLQFELSLGQNKEHVDPKVLKKGFTKNIMDDLKAKSDLTIFRERLNELAMFPHEVTKENKEALEHLAETLPEVRENPEIVSFMQIIFEKSNGINCGEVNSFVAQHDAEKKLNPVAGDLLSAESFAHVLVRHKKDSPTEEDNKNQATAIFRQKDSRKTVHTIENGNTAKIIAFLETQGVSKTICDYLRQNLTPEKLYQHARYPEARIPQITEGENREQPFQNILRLSFVIMNENKIKLKISRGTLVEYAVEIKACHQPTPDSTACDQIELSAESFYFNADRALLARKASANEITREGESYVRKIILPYYEITEENSLVCKVERADTDTLILIAKHGFTFISKLTAIARLRDINPAKYNNMINHSRGNPASFDDVIFRLLETDTANLKIKECLSSRLFTRDAKKRTLDFALDNNAKFANQLVNLVLEENPTTINFLKSKRSFSFSGKLTKARHRAASEILTICKIITKPSDESTQSRVESLPFEARKILAKELPLVSVDENGNKTIIGFILNGLTAVQQLEILECFSSSQSEYKTFIEEKIRKTLAATPKANLAKQSTQPEQLKKLATLDTTGKTLTDIIEGSTQKKYEPRLLERIFGLRRYKRQANAEIEKQEKAVELFTFEDVANLVASKSVGASLPIEFCEAKFERRLDQFSEKLLNPDENADTLAEDFTQLLTFAEKFQNPRVNAKISRFVKTLSFENTENDTTKRKNNLSLLKIFFSEVGFIKLMKEPGTFGLSPDTQEFVSDLYRYNNNELDSMLERNIDEIHPTVAIELRTQTVGRREKQQREVKGSFGKVIAELNTFSPNSLKPAPAKASVVEAKDIPAMPVALTETPGSPVVEKPAGITTVNDNTVEPTQTPDSDFVGITRELAAASHTSIDSIPTAKIVNDALDETDAATPQPPAHVDTLSKDLLLVAQKLKRRLETDLENVEARDETLNTVSPLSTSRDSQPSVVESPRSFQSQVGI